MRNSQIPGIREIPQIPGNLENSPYTWESGKFPKCLGISEIPQMPGNLGNSQLPKRI